MTCDVFSSWLGVGVQTLIKADAVVIHKLCLPEIRTRDVGVELHFPMDDFKSIDTITMVKIVGHRDHC